MADTKLSDLSSGAPAAATDIIYAVKDPSGTPADAKLTLGEVKTLVNTPGGSDTQVQFNDGGAFAGDADLTWNKTDNVLTLGTDVLIRRRNTRVLQLGAADAATPLAQTLSVQSTVAGTTNTAGANLTITGSQGTGTGAGGSIIFQVAPAGSSGTAQNALVDALTINSNRSVTLAAGSVTLKRGQTSNYLIYDQAGLETLQITGGTIELVGNCLLSWGNTNNTFTGYTADLTLRRDAANTLALRNGANAQEQRVYGSFTATDNFQRMSIKTRRESSGALSGASYTTTIAIPAYAVPVGVTTRVTTAITGATSYDVGDGTDVDLWGDNIGITLGSQSRTADFTAIAAVDAAATARTVTLTAVGSNFTGGVVEICVHYLTTEAD